MILILSGINDFLRTTLRLGPILLITVKTARGIIILGLTILLCVLA
jgi:hypothetical protein